MVEMALMFAPIYRLGEEVRDGFLRMMLVNASEGSSGTFSRIMGMSGGKCTFYCRNLRA